MSYNKTNWDENTPINVPNLQKIEDGLEAIDIRTDGKVISLSGANENGRYTTFQDGTQICYKERFLDSQLSTGVHEFIWTFPRRFDFSRITVNISPAYQSVSDAERIGFIALEDGSSPNPFSNESVKVVIKVNQTTAQNVRIGLSAIGFRTV